MFKISYINPSKICLGYFIVAAIFFVGCQPTKYVSFLEYAKKDTVFASMVSPGGQLRISQKDVLGITVSSLNKELDLKFNTMITPSTANTGVVTQDPGYPIDTDGFVELHYVGKVKALGLTRNELEKKLQELLTPYLKEPIVHVKFLNKKVSVMGAVEKPQVIFLPEETISVLDAIIMSGDLTKQAKADEIYILRDTSDKVQLKRINLTNPSFMNSPWSMLQPNDIVYVRKDFTNELLEDNQRRVQLNVSIATSLVSMVALLVTILKK